MSLRIFMIVMQFKMIVLLTRINLNKKYYIYIFFVFLKLLKSICPIVLLIYSYQWLKFFLPLRLWYEHIFLFECDWYFVLCLFKFLGKKWYFNKLRIKNIKSTHSKKNLVSQRFFGCTDWIGTIASKINVTP